MSKPTHTILIADDNPENLGVLSRILGDEGYKVRTAQNGKLALKSIQASIPDMALIDLHMPEMDGYELCKQIKNDGRLKHIPVLFISAIAESFNKVIAFELGAVDYINKPVDPKEVLARVGTHLKIRELQNELEEKNCSLETQVKERTADLDEALESLKLVNEKLSSLDEAKNNFLSLISHELRTPLVGLGIIDELLNGEPLSEEESKQFQNIFWASHQKLINIVEHATILTRLNLNTSIYTFGSQEIKKLISDACEMLTPLLETSCVSIELEKEENLTLYCDAEYGKMVFNALLETAIKFTYPNHSIKIDWETQDNQSVVYIKAYGWTLPEKHTERFFEVLGMNETIFPGGDLGLAPAVAKQVMNACGGKILVANRDTEGITLTIIFPNYDPSID